MAADKTPLFLSGRVKYYVVVTAFHCGSLQSAFRNARSRIGYAIPTGYETKT